MIKMSSYVTPLLYRCNVMNGTADISHGELTEAQRKVSPIFITLPLLHTGCLPWKVLSSFIYHCSWQPELDDKAPFSSLIPPIMPDMTDSWLGLPNSQILHAPPCNHEKYSLPSSGLSPALHYQQPLRQDLILFLSPLGSN